MKISKSLFLNILQEEAGRVLTEEITPQQLEKIADKIISKLDSIDMSMDLVYGALIGTGQAPIATRASQRALGRAMVPRTTPNPQVNELFGFGKKAKKKKEDEKISSAVKGFASAAKADAAIKADVEKRFGASGEESEEPEKTKGQLEKDTPLSINTRQKGVTAGAGGQKEMPLNMIIQKMGLDNRTAQKIARRIGDYLKQRDIPIAEALNSGAIDILIERLIQHMGVNGLLLEDTATNKVRKSILGQMQSLLQPKAKEEAKDRGAKMVLAMHGLAKSGDVEKFRNTILKWATRTGKGPKIGGWIRGNEKAQKEFADLPPEEIKQLMNSLLVDDKFKKYHKAGFEWRKERQAEKAVERGHYRGVATKADAGILGKILARYVSDNQELLGDEALRDLFNDTTKFAKFVKNIRKYVGRMMKRRGYDEAEIGKLLESLAGEK